MRDDFLNQFSLRNNFANCPFNKTNNQRSRSPLIHFPSFPPKKIQFDSTFDNKKSPGLYSRIPINLDQGIPMDLLEASNNKLKDYITCGICLDILLNPICCRNCKKKYCKNCIFRYKINNNQNKCPNCRQNFEIIEIDHTTKDILNDIKLKCYFYKKGCKELLIYDNFIKHINICEKGEYKCKTKNCDFISNLENMIEHVHKCGLSLIECNYCFNNFQKIIFDEHFNKCKNEIVPCYYCKETMKKCKLKEHEDHDCPKYKIECNNCGEKICRENMNNHKNNKFECYENRINHLENYKKSSEKLIKKLIERVNKLEKELIKEKAGNDNSNNDKLMEIFNIYNKNDNEINIKQMNNCNNYNSNENKYFNYTNPFLNVTKQKK